MSLVRRMDAAAAGGAALLGEAVLSPLRQGVLAHQQPDGGFRGRSGGSDAWYTAFALRCLELTGGIPEGIATSVRGWLERQAKPADRRAHLDHVTIALLVRAAPPPTQSWPAATGSYDAFAAAVAADLQGLAVPMFSESALHAEMATQVPATAAALIALRLAGRLDASQRERAVAYLVAQQQPCGGLLVHAGAPQADLLSTATAAWALAACRRLQGADVAGLARFAVACRRSDGFGALPGDEASDPEYTWYGLTLLALLRRFSNPGPAGWLRRRGWWPP